MNYFGDHGRELATKTHRSNTLHDDERKRKTSIEGQFQIPFYKSDCGNASDYGIGSYGCQELSITMGMG